MVHRASQAVLLVLFAATALAAGCSKSAGNDEAPCSAESTTWGLIEEVTLDSHGSSSPIAISLPKGSEIVSLRVSDPTGNPVCVQLESVMDPVAGAWVTAGPGDFGPYCLSCPQRVSVGIGYGLFVLPSNSQLPSHPSVLNVVASARDCTTLLRAGATRPERLRVEALFRPESPAQRTGEIRLRLAFRSGAPLADANALSEVMETVNAQLSPGGLRVRVDRTSTFESSDELSLTRGDNAPLDELYRKTQVGADDCRTATDDRVVPVVFAGCIRVLDSLTQSTTEPDGMTPGIPSGFPTSGRATGIYVKDKSCHSDAALPWQPALLAKLLAHELGHYLGLYHSVEPEGTVDQLDDTDAQNLMFYNPLESSAQSLSRSQLEVMRRHPVIRWDDEAP